MIGENIIKPFRISTGNHATNSVQDASYGYQSANLHPVMNTSRNFPGLFLILIPGLCFNICAQPLKPVKTLEVPPITEQPVMDGLLNEDFWSPEQPTEFFLDYKSNAEWGGEQDFSCSFHVAWGLSNLYLLIEVSDDIEHSWNGADGNQWEFDNIEVYFQLDTNTVVTSYDSTAVVIRFCRGETGWAAESGRAEEYEFGVFYTSSDSGWLLETAIPWTCTLPAGANAEDIQAYLPVIGFDIIVTDSDNADGVENAGSPELEITWDPDDLGEPSDNPEWPYIWNNTSIFGYLTLLGTPVNAIENNRSRGDFGIFPNPALNTIRFTNLSNIQRVDIYNMQGTLVHSAMYSPDQELEISELPCGVYIAVSGQGRQARFVKE